MEAGGRGHESQPMRGSQAKAKATVREVKLQCQEKGAVADKSGWSWRDPNKCLDRGMPSRDWRGGGVAVYALCMLSAVVLTEQGFISGIECLPRIPH